MAETSVITTPSAIMCENVHGLSVVDDEVHGLSALWLVILAGVIGLVWVLVT